jgi:hypothetical protein
MPYRYFEFESVNEFSPAKKWRLWRASYISLRERSILGTSKLSSITTFCRSTFLLRRVAVSAGRPNPGQRGGPLNSGGKRTF